jgi:hypothetical protein
MKTCTSAKALETEKAKTAAAEKRDRNLMRAPD